MIKKNVGGCIENLCQSAYVWINAYKLMALNEWILPQNIPMTERHA